MSLGRGLGQWAGLLGCIFKRGVACRDGAWFVQVGGAKQEVLMKERVGAWLIGVGGARAVVLMGVACERGAWLSWEAGPEG